MNNKPIKVAILGAGRIAYVHAKAMSQHVDNVVIEYVADPYLNSQTQTKFAQLGVKNFSKDIDQVINDPSVDVVYICTPTPTHAQYCLAALKNNKHVFCEKPISLNLQEIQEIEKVATKTNKLFSVGHNRRFDHNFLALKKAIQDNKIGQVYQIKISSRDPYLPPIEYLKTSGNLFYDMMVHDLDMARFLSNSPIKKVFAYGSALVDPINVSAVKDLDTAVVILMCEDKSMIIIDNCRQSSYGYDQRVEVLGSSGALNIENDKASTLIFSHQDGIVSEKPLDFFLERYMQAYINETIQFLQAITNNSPVAVNLNDGKQAILLAAAATKSWKENRVVSLEEVENENS